MKKLSLHISTSVRVFFILVFLTTVCTLIAFPKELPIHTPKLPLLNKKIDIVLRRPIFHINFLGYPLTNDVEIKEGLDIQGGMQVVLRADMKNIQPADRTTALNSAKEVIQNRVDLYGVSEPVVQTSQVGDDYRIIVELAGVKDPNQALQLIGTTAQLDFRLQLASPSAQASQSAMLFLQQFIPTGLTGKQLKRAGVQFDPKTGEPVVSMEFNDEGTKLFADVTKQGEGRILAIFLDGAPVTFPRINSAILDGHAVITGNFTIDTAKQLSIQLNAGALPVPIEILQQQTIGATLGSQSVQKSVLAGLVGIIFVVAFMILNYGWKGFLASISLFVYAVITVTIYKLFNVTLTLPGIAGLLLSIGMAVDSNILIFERMKEELRVGKPFSQAMQLGFSRAWNSIKDANLTTIFIALILINPMDFNFLNRSGLVKGFGLTLFIGVLVSLFTSMVVTRTLMTLFLRGKDE